jgi:hypothetical protein
MILVEILGKRARICACLTGRIIMAAVLQEDLAASLYCPSLRDLPTEPRQGRKGYMCTFFLSPLLGSAGCVP